MKFLITNFFHIKTFRGHEKAVSFFTFFYIFFFSFYDYYSGKRGNIEFLLYIFSMFLLLNIGIYLHKILQFPFIIFFGLSLFGLFHILGGVIAADGQRLYEKYILLDIIRYDNLIHLFGAFLGTLILHMLYQKKFLSHQSYLLYFFSLFLMSLGIGVINELVEFFGVTFFHIENRVGDYYNNALDLVYNAMGSLIALIFIDKAKNK